MLQLGLEQEEVAPANTTLNLNSCSLTCQNGPGNTVNPITLFKKKTVCASLLREKTFLIEQAWAKAKHCLH